MIEVIILALLQQWQEFAEEKQSENDTAKYWKAYFDREKAMYAKILTDKPQPNTVKGFSEFFNVDMMTMVGFLDGINDSLKKKNELEELEEESTVGLDYEDELLYKNMVEAKADWLYGLPEWDSHLTEERRDELYKEQKKSQTVVKGEKIGRNDPCPCGSGKKYKKCCGLNA